ncbi:uncharacterized protein LOC130638037 [Hydractinia symbiolongicarpus]|uniref:uncharacterized protein LOC130638037 n=1 Tax=Hydractinia symbiolongicarpus TaxID=13093 RepID=UPI002551C5D3|nr:uncharacterized protein LOC130638037 [Hydractinia symbiolongicarpus]
MVTERRIMHWWTVGQKKTIKIKVTKSIFKCSLGILIHCNRQNSAIKIEASTFQADNDPYQRYIFGVKTVKCFTIVLNKLKFSGFQTSAVQVYSAFSLTIYNSSFERNKSIRGGAVFIYNTDFWNVHNSFFSFNTAGTGGAIYVYKGKGASVVNSSIFFYNSANITGGSIYIKTQVTRYDRAFYLNSVRFIGTTHSPLTTGIIINTGAQISYTDVSIIIDKTVLDAPVLDGIRLDDKFRYGEDNFDNLSLFCPHNFGIAYFKPTIAFQCRRCERGMYSLKGDSVTLSMVNRTMSENKLVVKKSDFRCFRCPPGGKCEYGIQSKGNFWGYIGKSKEIEFLPCPTAYCCSEKTKKCVSYNTCNKKRTGILCGACENGHTLNYFSNSCVRKNRCNQWLFWIFYVAYAVFYVVFLMYFKIIFKTLYENLRKLKCGRKKAGIINDLYQYTPFQDSMDENMKETNIYEEEDCPFSNAAVLKTEGRQTNVCILGLKNITFFFYQMQALIEINAPEEKGHSYIIHIKHTISIFFNFQLSQLNISNLCPMKDLDALSKASIKLGNVFIIFLILLALVAIIKIFQRYKNRRNLDAVPSGTTIHKIMKNICICSIQVGLLGYTAVNVFCFHMLNCVSINDKNYLYMQGDIACYNWWQYCILVVTILWIIRFTISVHVSVNMLRRNQITLNQFYPSFAIPPISLYYYLRSLCTNNTVDVMTNTEDIDKVTEIFIGPYISNKNGQLNWEAVLIGRRIIIAALCAFVVNPISKLFFTLLVFHVCLLHHLYVLPYRTRILNHLETGSLSCLIFLNVENLFFAFLYMNDQSSVPAINTMAMVFVWVEHIVLLLPLLIIIFITLLALCKKPHAN